MVGSNQYALSCNAAELYERNMVTAIFAPFAVDLLEFAKLEQGEAVLDVACGTGIVTRLAWPMVAPGGRLVGLDINAKMLEVAEGVGPGSDSRVEWVEGNVTDMPFHNAEFDVAICQHGVQYFADRPAALSEIHRVLGNQGRLILSVWRPIKFNPGHKTFADVLERRVSVEAAATRRAPFKLSDRDALRKLVSEAGFQDVNVALTTRIARFPSAEAMVRIMIGGTPLGATMGDSDAALLGTITDEVAEKLSEYEDDFGLAIPMQAWVAAARV